MRLLVLYNFQAQAPDDLSVSRGEIVVADVSKQDNDDWVWVTSDSQGRSGYIPRTYAKEAGAVGEVRPLQSVS